MTRWLFTLAAALSLLLSIAAAAAWATRHARPNGWRLLGVAHSADLTRVNRDARAVLFTTTPDWSNDQHHGFWDAGWVLSRSGRLTVLAQAVDYEGTPRRVYASPPSLTVDLPGEAHSRALLFGGVPDSGPTGGRFGFDFHSDTHPADAIGGPVRARAWMVTLPHAAIVLFGLPLPLRWLRATRARRRGAPPPPTASAPLHGGSSASR